MEEQAFPHTLGNGVAVLFTEHKCSYIVAIHNSKLTLTKHGGKFKEEEEEEKKEIQSFIKTTCAPGFTAAIAST